MLLAERERENHLVCVCKKRRVCDTPYDGSYSRGRSFCLDTRGLSASSAAVFIYFSFVFLGGHAGNPRPTVAKRNSWTAAVKRGSPQILMRQLEPPPCQRRRFLPFGGGYERFWLWWMSRGERATPRVPPEDMGAASTPSDAVLAPRGPSRSYPKNDDNVYWLSIFIFGSCTNLGGRCTERSTSFLFLFQAGSCIYFLRFWPVSCLLVLEKL